MSQSCVCSKAMQLVMRHAPLRNKCLAVNADDDRACIIQDGSTRLKRTFVFGLISVERDVGDEGLGICRSWHSLGHGEPLVSTSSTFVVFVPRFTTSPTWSLTCHNALLWSFYNAAINVNAISVSIWPSAGKQLYVVCPRTRSWPNVAADECG